MVEAPPQPRARPPLLRKNTLLVESVAAAAAHRALNPPQAPEPEQIPRISAPPRPRKIAVAKKATKAEEVVATLVTAAVMAASVVAVAILAAVIAITFRCKTAKCQPEKKSKNSNRFKLNFY